MHGETVKTLLDVCIHNAAHLKNFTTNHNDCSFIQHKLYVLH